jgi:hypothetical protein
MRNGAHDGPVIFRIDGKAACDQIAGAVGISADHTRYEADKHAGIVGVAQTAIAAHRLHRRRQTLRLRLVPIAVDPGEHVFGRQEFGRTRRRRGGRCSRKCQNEQDDGGAHVPSPMRATTATASADFMSGDGRDFARCRNNAARLTGCGSRC